MRFLFHRHFNLVFIICTWENNSNLKNIHFLFNIFFVVRGGWCGCKPKRVWVNAESRKIWCASVIKRDGWANAEESPSVEYFINKRNTSRNWDGRSRRIVAAALSIRKPRASEVRGCHRRHLSSDFKTNDAETDSDY